MYLILPILNHVCNINKIGDCRLHSQTDPQSTLRAGLSFTLSAQDTEAAEVVVHLTIIGVFE